MELDELKKNWELLNDELRKSEILNRKVAKKLIEKRALSARDRLVKPTYWPSESLYSFWPSFRWLPHR